MDSFFYIITHLNEVLALRETKSTPQDNFQSVITADELLRLPYGETRIAFFSARNTFVPTRLYNPNEKQTYLSHVAGTATTERILADHISRQNAQNVYAVPDTVFEAFRQKFPTARTFHLNTVLLQQLHALADEEDFKFFLNVREQYLQVFLFKGKKLLFNNAFQFRSSKDFVYFVLLVFDQFKLKPENVPTIFSGQLIEDSEVYNLVNRYVPTLQRIAVKDFFTFHEQFHAQSQQPHFYFDAYALEQYEK